MLSICWYEKHLRPRPLSITVLATIICAGLIAYARSSRGSNPYSLAEDLPRGALVYAQFRDLPALIKQWDESRLKQQYLRSTNYQQFQHQHLALKLIQRWQEFNSALGFQLDTVTISGSTEAGAAIAIYDIGRLDLLLIAPMSEEKIAATKFFQSKEQFEETELPDRTTYYRHEVEADRGRQKQALVFAALKGRFILATNERLLLRTISNINGQTAKDRLWDDPAFKTLSASLSPHFATVWVDQAKLNEDWYFKHYWLMQNVDQLRGIGACIFDLERQVGKWIEQRDCLSAGREGRKSFAIPAADAERMRAMIPEDVPFFKLLSLGNDQTVTAAVVRDTLLDRRPREQRQHTSSWSWRSYDDQDFYLAAADEDAEYYERYSYLNGNYDSTIDDPHEARISERDEPGGNPLGNELENQFTAGLQQAIGPARPLLAAVATSPRTIGGPLFVEFRRVAILTLQAPADLRRAALENAISKAAQSHVTIAGPSVDLKWVGHDQDDQSWRGLELPMLGWKFCYALRDRELILANSPELLMAVLAVRSRQAASEIQSISSLDDLTVIRLDQRKPALDDIIGKLDAAGIKVSQAAGSQSNNGSDGLSQEFFSSNISSLLSVASAVSRIEIKRSSFPNRLHEEIDFILK